MAASAAAVAAASAGAAETLICIGDCVSLYSPEAGGYIFNKQSIDTNNTLAVTNDKNTAFPKLPNPHVAVFEVSIARRYKFDKKYRQILEQSKKRPDDVSLKARLAEAEHAKKAEEEGNAAEQKRLLGKPVTYGSVIQLKHLFTEKFVHISSNKTSKTSSSDMMVELLEYSLKHAHFKIMPRYKVKSEGDFVAFDDQIVLESVKSVGQYIRVSSIPLKYPMSAEEGKLEVNLSVRQTGLQIFKYSSPVSEHGCLRGGSAVRFFHKELEAYLCAEGLFDWIDHQAPHLRIREVNPAIPKTMSHSSSAITYWQIELEEGPLHGEPIRWENQVRLRHMVTRKYLSVSAGDFAMTGNGQDPSTVFRITPVIAGGDLTVHPDTYARFEHVVSGMWLHALPDKFSKRGRPSTSNKRNHMGDLQWDKGVCRQIGLSPDMQYDDAFTLQEVSPDLVRVFNFAAGCVPMLQKLVHQRENGIQLTEASSERMCQMLRLLKDFMFENGVHQKYRQKLLRNLMIVELLISVLQIDIKLAPDHKLLSKVFVGCYEVMFTYLLGNSRKNELYIANHINFFLTQISFQDDIGVWATTMVTELIRDNRQIVDRMQPSHIDDFVNLLFQNQNYRYLDLLNVLCVCDGVSIPDNQNYVCRKWLVESVNGSNSCCYLTETGSRLSARTGKTYDSTMTWVSTNNGKTWVSLLQLATHGRSDQLLFLTHQLELFEKLASGRNAYTNKVITSTLDYLTWQEAFMCLSDERLPSDLRAKYCSLIIVLFIDFGMNFSALDRVQLTFVYDNLDKPKGYRRQDTDMIKKAAEGAKVTALVKEAASKVKSREDELDDGVINFREIRQWIERFLEKSQSMVASEVGYNMMIRQVLRMIWYMVAFGYYSDTADGGVTKLLRVVVTIMDGTNDVPYPADHIRKLNSVDREKMQSYFQNHQRFIPNEQTQVIADVKLEAMRILDLILNLRFNTRMIKFILLFKKVDAASKNLQSGGNKDLVPLLSSEFDLEDSQSPFQASRAAMHKIMQETAFLRDNGAQVTSILLDSMKYQFDDLVTMSMHILCRLHSAHELMFERAVTAQVVITDSSVEFFHRVSEKLPILRSLTSSKLSDDQVEVVEEILTYFTRACIINEKSEEPHHMNQSILYNQGIIADVFDVFSNKSENALEGYDGMRKVIGRCFDLLRAMAKGNPTVQTRLYDRMFDLLEVPGANRQLARALTEVFTNNKNNCLKCPKSFIKRVMEVLSEKREPYLLVLLQAIVKVEEINLPIKGNQNSVMKFFMEHREQIAPMLGDNNQYAQLMKNDNADMRYFIRLIDLFATCAEGENRFIESICQTIFSVDDLLELLVDRDLGPAIKNAMLRFLLWVYVNTGDAASSASLRLSEDMRIWGFLGLIASDIKQLMDTFSKDPNFGKMVKTGPGPVKLGKDNHWMTHYVLEAAIPFLEVFFKDSYEKDRVQAEQRDLVSKLATTVMEFTIKVQPEINSDIRLRSLIKSTSVLLNKSNLSDSVRKSFQARFGQRKTASEFISQAMKKYRDEYEGEEMVNGVLNVFANNMKKCYGGINTVKEQIGFPSKREYAEQLDEGGDEELPLGDEFQHLLSCFKGELSGKLLDTLWIQDHKNYTNEQIRLEATRLDIKCLKLLRALIHNEERKLPEDWENHTYKHRGQLEVIREVQNQLDSMGAIRKVVPLLAKKNDDVVRETLALVVMLLFNANERLQDSFLQFFLGTREETFFYSVKSRMVISAIATKEKKALLSQYEAKISEALQMMKTLQKSRGDHGKSKASLGSRVHMGSMTSMRKQMKELQKSQKNLKSQRNLQNHQPLENGKLDTKHDNKYGSSLVPSNKVSPGDEHEEMDDMEADNGEDIFEAISSAGDDGYIELILKMLGMMCDGQHAGIQNYLREQPDNIKSFNLVAETCQFLQILYSNINAVNITLVTEIFSALLEMCSGNFANQEVAFDNKAIDCVNHILRVSSYQSCSLDQVYELKKTIGEFVIAMIEENNPDNESNVREVKESLDAIAIHETFANAYRLTQCKLSDMELSDLGVEEDDDLEESEELIVSVGFKFYHIYVRLQDIGGTPLPSEKEIISEMGDVGVEAFKFHDEKCMTIEILKNGNLQKVSFRVTNQDVLREEVKEMMKWQVDRSSPSNKIRDFVAWSKDIISDIKYQTRVMSYAPARFLIKNSNKWHLSVLLITFILNLMMLFAWRGNKQDVFAIRPRYPTWYPFALYALGGIHVLLSIIIVVEYFLSNRPAFPTPSGIKDSVKSLLGLDSGKSDDEKPEVENHLRVDFFSLKTFYHLLFLGMSIAGIIFEGYFFCFHMLHVVPRNQMLMRVLQSVTLNGTSLLLVALLGTIIIWIYSVAGFAFVRYAFQGFDGLYCETMFQCFITSLRYGIIDGLQEYVGVPEEYASFRHYSLRMLYDVSFFIIFVTILMNIIFGIIVDTFSELRDLKWQAEEDMTSHCFICSRSSYDFEHHGKGFEYHVKKEHNMWAYLFYFIHLDETRTNDYTAIDLYVYRLLQRENNDFFPLNRALVLDDEDDVVDTKLEILQEGMNKLLRKQEEEDLMELKRQQKEKVTTFKDKHAGKNPTDSKPQPAALDSDLKMARSRTSASRAGVRARPPSQK